ncbi:hypothetical protein ACIOC2_00740 [Streptomyces sp. NPDC088337]|uniref:hypothetical protein n=1 Tax=unclassified Streptomyces TaxID=2593676 RepID=UPI002DD93899|nr:hypothetical protein [Streptomyces sp. NBC_01788]WSB26717.1 hypothetical protein OIE49_12865 [Streptomyces sp. NBC_01788]
MKYYFFPQKTGDVVVVSLGRQGCTVRIAHNESDDLEKPAGKQNVQIRQLRTADACLRDFTGMFDQATTPR